jgi:hypothetical protein
MPDDTWANRYPGAKLEKGKPRTIVPFLTQLADAHVVFDKVSFYTRRSFVPHGNGGADDPLNQGWMIVGAGKKAPISTPGRSRPRKSCRKNGTTRT